MERNAVEDSLEPTRGMPIEPPIHPKSMHRALIVAIGGTGRRWKRNARPYGTAALLLLLLVLLSLSSAVYPAIQLVSASEPVVVDSKTAPSPTIIDTNGSTPTKVSTAGTASASTDEPTSASKKDDWTTLFLDTAKRTLLEGTQSFLQLLPSSFTSIYPFARTLLGEVKDWPTTLLAYRLVLRPPFLVNLYSKYSSHLNEPYAQAPSSSKGSILILEAKGGSDKMPSWHRHAGHRPDTVAIANAITRRGWKAVVWPYEDSTRGKFEELVKNGIVGDDDGNTMESASADETATANNGTNSSAESATANTNTNTNTTNNNSNGKPAFEALVWRVNPQSHDPYVRSLVPLEQLVVDLSSSSTIPLLAPHPKLMHTLGAKQGLFHLRGMKIGMADTKRYTSRSELAKFATVLSGSYNEGIDALQKARLDLQYRGTSNSTMVYSPGFGGRVLKQNRGSQGEGVFVVRLLNPPAWSAEGYQVWPLPSNNEDLTRLPKALPLDTQLSIQEASDNKFRNSTLGDFLTWMEAMFMEAPETVEGEGKEDRMVIDQMFLRRIREGEVRVVMGGSFRSAIRSCFDVCPAHASSRVETHSARSTSSRHPQSTLTGRHRLYQRHALLGSRPRTVLGLLRRPPAPFPTDHPNPPRRIARDSQSSFGRRRGMAFIVDNGLYSPRQTHLGPCNLVGQ